MIRAAAIFADWPALAAGASCAGDRLALRATAPEGPSSFNRPRCWIGDCPAARSSVDARREVKRPAYSEWRRIAHGVFGAGLPATRPDPRGLGRTAYLRGYALAQLVENPRAANPSRVREVLLRSGECRAQPWAREATFSPTRTLSLWLGKQGHPIGVFSISGDCFELLRSIDHARTTR
jgi:hypothetical protein